MLLGAHRPFTHPQGLLSCLASTQDGNKRGSVCCSFSSHMRPPSCPSCAMSIPCPSSSFVLQFEHHFLREPALPLSPFSLTNPQQLGPLERKPLWSRCCHLCRGKTHDTVVGFLPCGICSLSPTLRSSGCSRGGQKAEEANSRWSQKAQTLPVPAEQLRGHVGAWWGLGRYLK